VGILIDLQPDAGPALVIGGGTVAARKVRALAEAGFSVTVIAPEVARAIRDSGAVTVIERPFEPGDLGPGTHYALVFACTDSREVNRAAGELAHERGIPVVVADAQDESTFFSPATVRDGELAIAVSTGGASPVLAREIREKIVAALGPGWGTAIAAARTERESRLGRGSRTRAGQ
jgi:siroheme synthase-like protein